MTPAQPQKTTRIDKLAEIATQLLADLDTLVDGRPWPQLGSPVTEHLTLKYLQAVYDLAVQETREWRMDELEAVMVSVDKWFKDGDTRAADAREIALQALEKAVQETRQEDAKYLHSSVPDGYRCSDCTIDGEACPNCYRAGWERAHPNVHFTGGRHYSRPDEVAASLQAGVPHPTREK